MVPQLRSYYYFQRKLVVVSYILAALGLFASILLAIFEGIFNWIAFVLLPLYFLFQPYCYVNQVNTMVKRDSEVHETEISVETIITNEYIQNTASNGAVNKLEYDKIKSATQTKNLILLRSKANLIYIFRKDTFTKGTKDEFVVFLASKGIKVK